MAGKQARTKLASRKKQASGVESNRKPLVLVVDDDETFIELVEMIMQKEFDVVTAVDGTDALRKFRRHHPDMVVTDIVMPRLDGFVLISELRKLTDKPILAVSGGITECSTRALSELGADGFIAKPDVYNKLLIKVQELFQVYQLESSAAQTSASLSSKQAV